MMRVFKRVLVNTGLVLASALGGVVVCELVLRFAFPKYERLAASVLRPDQERIWANAPGARRLVRHPDTGQYHLSRHNDLGLRQHRNVNPSSWRRERRGRGRGVVQVAFFGDSFLENTQLPVQYSFTEPLDYLLNVAGQDRFNVLNFGTDGYGTDQSYLRYVSFKETNLDYVFYLFSVNDIWGIPATGLFRFDASGELTQVVADQAHFLLRLLSKLHVTYLVLDMSKTLSVTWAEVYRDVGSDLRTRWLDRLRSLAAAGKDGLRSSDDGHKEGLRLFGALLRRWKTAVEAAGGAFHVVYLPQDGFLASTGTWSQVRHDLLLKARRVVEQDVRARTVDLLACAEERIPDFTYQAIRFRNDSHWNEAGNMLAARCLYRFIERSTQLPRATEATLSDRLHTYYSAFRDDGGPLPLAPQASDAPPLVDDEALTAIRRKYLELDLLAADALGEAARKARKGEPAARAEWDIYALDDSLLYRKTDCQAEDAEPNFFLHWVPVGGAGDLPFAHVGKEFVNGDFTFATHGRVVDGDCLAHVPLPPFSVTSARTGQYEEIGEEEYRNIWQAHVPLGKP